MRLMKALILVILILITLCACNDAKEKELELRERELEVKEKEFQTKLESEKKVSDDESALRGPIKYLYVLIETREPKVGPLEESEEAKKYDNELPGFDKRPAYFAEYTAYTYKSDIVEIDNYTKDEEYKEIDKYEKEVARGFAYTNMMAEYEWNNPDHKVSGQVPKCYVALKMAFVFDSYEKASKDKDMRSGF